jgi:hypothetical protein
MDYTFQISFHQANMIFSCGIKDKQYLKSHTKSPSYLQHTHNNNPHSLSCNNNLEDINKNNVPIAQ